MKKGDILIITASLLLAACFLFINGRRQQGEYVHITANGSKTTYPLSENRTIELKSFSSGYNIIVIADGQVTMESASCPDKICVHHKAVSKNGESIICLPNEVFVEIESKKQKETDN